LNVHDYIFAKLGRCPNCMRTSLRGAIVGWLCTAIVAWLWPPLTRFVVAWPLAFSMLWLLHIAVLAFRVAKASFPLVATRPIGSENAFSRGRFLALASGAAMGIMLSLGRPLPVGAQPCPPGTINLSCGRCLYPPVICCGNSPCPAVPGYVCLYCGNNAYCTAAGSTCLEGGKVRLKNGTVLSRAQALEMTKKAAQLAHTKRPSGAY
jgi:hypothetical protein